MNTYVAGPTVLGTKSGQFNVIYYLFFIDTSEGKAMSLKWNVLYPLFF